MNVEERKEFLTRELLIGVNIYEQTVVLGNQIWFSKLVDMLKDDMHRSQVSRGIDHMFDCGMLKGGYEQVKGEKFVCYCYRLSGCYCDYFKGAYEVSKNDK